MQGTLPSLANLTSLLYVGCIEHGWLVRVPTHMPTAPPPPNHHSLWHTSQPTLVSPPTDPVESPTLVSPHPTPA